MVKCFVFKTLGLTRTIKNYKLKGRKAKIVQVIEGIKFVQAF